MDKKDKPISCVEVTINEMAVLNALREETPFLSVTIKKGTHGNVKRITVHRENDVFLEEKL